MRSRDPFSTLTALLPGGVAVTPDDMAQAPRWSGAYVVLLHLPEPVTVAHRKARGHFPPGWFAYCGSARGPGGVGARLSRHFRKDKALHWHVDGLTVRADGLHALAFAGASECDLVAALLASGDLTVPVAGFGSSDCRACAAHLLSWRPENTAR